MNKAISILVTVFLTSCQITYHLGEVHGTTWKYKDADRKYTITFHPNGVLKNTHPNDNTPDNDQWWTSGDTLFFSFNDRYAVYYAVTTKNNKMKGLGRNKDKSWKFTLSK